MKITPSQPLEDRIARDDARSAFEAGLGDTDISSMASLVSCLTGMLSPKGSQDLEYTAAEFYAFTDDVDGIILF